MKKISSRWLLALLLTGVLAIPAGAIAQHQQFRGGVGGNAAPPRVIGGGGRSFGGGIRSISRVGGGGRPAFSQHIGRSFSPHLSRSFTPGIGRSFSTHVGRPAHFGTLRRGPRFSRSANGTRRLRNVQRVRRVHRIAQRKGTGRTLRNARSVQQHIGTAATTAETAHRGRFAARFDDRRHHHFANIAAHRAWRRGLRAGFVAWYGPVFWPYAYSDIFDYAFWPYGYDDSYWFYAYDDFFDGVFWGEYGPPVEYAGAAAAAYVPHASHAGVEELCTQPGTGITAWPFAAIERKVGLNSEQKQLLGDMRKAASDATAAFKASCPPNEAFPLTPPGRLLAMTARLQGTLDAVRTVRPALEKFYASLSDEQKERFNQLGPKTPAQVASKSPETTGTSTAEAKSCKQPKPGLTAMPIEQIKAVVKPTDAQQDALKQLQEATDQAVSLLQSACPEQVPLTPTGRLAAMEKRLKAMIDAANKVKPALNDFYTSLSNEQKARFDRLGQELAKTKG